MLIYFNQKSSPNSLPAPNGWLAYLRLMADGYPITLPLNGSNASDDIEFLKENDQDVIPIANKKVSSSSKREQVSHYEEEDAIGGNGKSLQGRKPFFSPLGSSDFEDMGLTPDLGELQHKIEQLSADMRLFMKVQIAQALKEMDEEELKILLNIVEGSDDENNFLVDEDDDGEGLVTVEIKESLGTLTALTEGIDKPDNTGPKSVGGRMGKSIVDAVEFTGLMGSVAHYIKVAYGQYRLHRRFDAYVKRDLTDNNFGYVSHKMSTLFAGTIDWAQAKEGINYETPVTREYVKLMNSRLPYLQSFTAAVGSGVGATALFVIFLDSILASLGNPLYVAEWAWVGILAALGVFVGIVLYGKAVGCVVKRRIQSAREDYLKAYKNCSQNWDPKWQIFSSSGRLQKASEIWSNHKMFEEMQILMLSEVVYLQVAKHGNIEDTLFDLDASEVKISKVQARCQKIRQEKYCLKKPGGVFPGFDAFRDMNIAQRELFYNLFEARRRAIQTSMDFALRDFVLTLIIEQGVFYQIEIMDKYPVLKHLFGNNVGITNKKGSRYALMKFLGFREEFIINILNEYGDPAAAARTLKMYFKQQTGGWTL